MKKNVFSAAGPINIEPRVDFRKVDFFVHHFLDSTISLNIPPFMSHLPWDLSKNFKDAWPGYLEDKFPKDQSSPEVPWLQVQLLGQRACVEHGPFACQVSRFQSPRSPGKTEGSNTLTCNLSTPNNSNSPEISQAIYDPTHIWPLKTNMQHQNIPKFVSSPFPAPPALHPWPLTLRSSPPLQHIAPPGPVAVARLPSAPPPRAARVLQGGALRRAAAPRRAAALGLWPAPQGRRKTAMAASWHKCWRLEGVLFKERELK